MADDADETIGVGKLSCLGGSSIKAFRHSRLSPKRTRWFIPEIPALATVFKAATQSRITEIDTLFQTKQAVLPEVGKSLPSYLIFQQANEHAKEPLWPHNRCWHELYTAKFSKQLFPEWLPLMSELIHQINIDKQKKSYKLNAHFWNIKEIPLIMVHRFNS